MKAAQVVIYILGILVTLAVITGWFGAAAFSAFWWDMVRIDFPEYGGKYLWFYIVTLLNWGLPALFIVSTLLSILLELFSPGNVFAAFFTLVSFVALFAGFVTCPLLIHWSSKYKCTSLFSTYRPPLSKEKSAEFARYIDRKTKGFTHEQKLNFVDNFDSIRCEKSQEILWFFLGLQLLSVVFVLVMAPLYTCTD